jgi:hypothetical protein
MTGRGSSIKPFTRCWTGRIGVGSGKVIRGEIMKRRQFLKALAAAAAVMGIGKPVAAIPVARHERTYDYGNRVLFSVRRVDLDKDGFGLVSVKPYRDEILMGKGRESWWEHINTEPPGDLIQIEPRPLQGAGVSGDDILTGDEELPTW